MKKALSVAQWRMHRKLTAWFTLAAISEQQVKVGEVVMATIHNADEYDL